MGIFAPQNEQKTAMKVSYGSIQKKGRHCYFVSRAGKRQRWVSLKTDDLRVARKRAHLFAAGEDGTEDWLRHLVSLGERAGRALKGLGRRSPPAWDALWRDFAGSSRASLPAASLPDYRRWLDLLAVAARHRPPAEMDREDARRVADLLRGRYVSADRMLRFFRRVWTTLDFGDDIWRDELGTARRRSACGKAGEFYRRLTVDEVRRVRNALLNAERTASGGVAAACADMVAIGYYTGLRLSDVAELEAAEVSPGRDFLRLQPNKVRHSKRRQLLIPLVREAREIVERRMKSPAEGRWLFPAAARKRPSRRICAAFHAAGIRKRGTARASFHSLRATFISQMDEGGVSPHVTDAITGHAAGGMHARYTQPSAQTLMDAVARAILPL